MSNTIFSIQGGASGGQYSYIITLMLDTNNRPNPISNGIILSNIGNISINSMTVFTPDITSITLMPILVAGVNLKLKNLTSVPYTIYAAAGNTIGGVSSYSLV